MIAQMRTKQKLYTLSHYHTHTMMRKCVPHTHTHTHTHTHNISHIPSITNDFLRKCVHQTKALLSL